jgi:hypothetical protein
LVADKSVQVMHTYGYEIVQTLIVDIEPDETVKRAMNEINAGDTSLSLLSPCAPSSKDGLCKIQMWVNFGHTTHKR